LTVVLLAGVGVAPHEWLAPPSVSPLIIELPGPHKTLLLPGTAAASERPLLLAAAGAWLALDDTLVALPVVMLLRAAFMRDPMGAAGGGGMAMGGAGPSAEATAGADALPLVSVPGCTMVPAGCTLLGGGTPCGDNLPGCGGITADGTPSGTLLPSVRIFEASPLPGVGAMTPASGLLELDAEAADPPF